MTDAEGRAIDLNLDAGEGVLDPRQEAELFTLVSSVNVACGFHAGDPYEMRRVVASARRHGVAVGAHPSLPDRSGFGRRVVGVSPEEVEADVAYQVGALAALCALVEARLHHVKPHGALYHLAAERAEVARAVVAAIARAAPAAVVYAPPASALEREARRARLVVAREGFADRGYDGTGRLLPRGHPAALLSPAEAAAQAVLLAGGRVRAADGYVSVPCETICVHGDTPSALDVARRVRGALEGAGVRVTPPLRSPRGAARPRPDATP